jgi:hypothetical protein
MKLIGTKSKSLRSCCPVKTVSFRPLFSSARVTAIVVCPKDFREVTNFSGL